MQTVSFEIRYPNGDFEIDTIEGRVPSIGETIRRRGRSWSVAQIAHDLMPILRVEHAQRRPRRGIEGVVGRSSTRS